MINTLTFFKKNMSQFSIAFLLCLFLTTIGLVSAGGMLCRSDPIVYLSDGTRLQVNIELQTSLDDVIGIHYELHVPAGVQIDRVIFTPNWARAKETVALIADQPAGHYQIVTTASTKSANVSATVKAMLVSRQNRGEGSSHQTMSGLSGQSIRISF